MHQCTGYEVAPFHAGIRHCHGKAVFENTGIDYDANRFGIVFGRSQRGGIGYGSRFSTAKNRKNHNTVVEVL